MTMVLDLISWVFLLSGSFFSIVGGVGIVRLPEFFSRLHGGGITDTMGAALIVIGLAFQAPVVLEAPKDATLVIIKLLMILFFLIVTSPSSCHALAKSAMTLGLQPVLDDDRKSKKK